MTDAVRPVLAVARSEVRRRWRALLVIGVLAGVVGATAVSAAALARRTTSAYERLGVTAAVDDVRGMVLRHPDLVDEIVELPMVTESWTGRIGIAQLEGSFAFLGITAGPAEPSPIVRPILLEGRFPAAAEADVIEVVLREDFQREVGIALGTEVAVRFLTEADYFRFDTGFVGGAPHGPRLTLRVVGTIRTAGGTATLPPGFSGPDALRAHPEAFVGSSYFVRLEGGASSVDAFAADVTRLAEGRTLPPEADEFVVTDVAGTAVAEAAVDNTALLLGRALGAVALTVALVGGFALIQALARHHAAGAAARDIERALGFTRGQQAAARLAAGSLPSVTAAVITAAGAVAAARLEPIGAIRQYEPHPGTAVNVALVGAGVVIVAVTLLLATALTSAFTRRRAGHVTRESTLVQRATRLGGPPPMILGLRFALEPGRGLRAVPVRSAITGSVVGLAGVVAGLVFVESLDRLVWSPARSATPFDALVADVTIEDLEAEVLANPLVGDVTIVESAPVAVDGVTINGHALTDVRGTLDIGIEEGRLPRTPDEIALGLRVAGELGKRSGDTVTVVSGDGSEHELAIVGTAVVPTFNGEELGLNALVTPEGLQASGAAAAFSGAAVQAAPGVDADALIDFLGGGFEADAQAVPMEVQNLRELGRLPATVSAVVGAIALLALTNALVVAVRRRAGDLAVLRAIGFTSRQTAVAVIVMALTIVGIGVLVGIPLGIAAGSTLWRATAEGAFVLADAHLRWIVIAAPAIGAVLIAVAAAGLPARQAARLTPAVRLRAE